jgi:hypothetical protein
LTPQARRQLDELYIPLMLMNARGKRVFRMFLSLLGRNYVFGSGRLPEQEMNLWAYWAEYAFIPMNAQIALLIYNKRDLIQGKMPDSFRRFMEYHFEFKSAHYRWKDEGGEYQHPGNFPADFEQDVLDAIGQLSLETGWLPKFLT